MQYSENALVLPPDYLGECWKIISSGTNKEKALEYAVKGLDFINNIVATKPDGEPVTEIYEWKLAGYHIAATAFLWNGKSAEAYALEDKFMHPGLWEDFEEPIEQYLVMLIMREETDHLSEIFEDLKFRKTFMPYYEAYISLLVDDKYEMTKMYETVPVINKVLNGKSIYGK